jgi:hypothetical protein
MACAKEAFRAAGAYAISICVGVQRCRLGLVQCLARSCFTQLKSFPGFAARSREFATRASTAVTLMDGQIDHTTGLLMLREGQAAADLVHRYGP